MKKDLNQRRELKNFDLTENSDYQVIEGEKNEYLFVNEINKGSKSSKFFKIIYFINLVITAIFIGFLQLKSLFIVKHRIVFISVLLAIYITGFIIVKFKKKIFLKSILSIFLIMLSITQVAGIYLYSKTERAFSKINRENVNVTKSDIKSSAFNVYISGLDIKGDIDVISRSDVNIIGSLNLNKAKAILTTVPRDSYLPIADGGNNEYDKLTHAGNYGVKSSMDTIANAFNINISYYLKVNFSSFIKIVDVVGGVDVENTQEFTSRVSGKEYKKGILHLNGERALDFVRERYGLADGDIDRARNQQKVVAAVLKKIASPKIIFNYSKVLEAVTNAISTNIPTNEIFNVLTTYIFSRGLDMKNQIVEGEGDFLPSYAEGTDLYMYVLDEDSVKNISKEINELLKK